MTVCLVVASIFGVWCYENAAPVGDCFNFSPFGGQVCYVGADELPLRASWYDPALGGVNCMEPCGQLGDGTAVSDGYGWVVACPDGWYGRWLDVEHAGRWQCRDHGGAIHPTYGRTYTADGFVECWWIAVDMLVREQPGYAYMLLGWQ